jgi:hypothetical protein
VAAINQPIQKIAQSTPAATRIPSISLRAYRAHRAPGD